MADILVAMSGGVDSSYAAYLLKKQGYQIIGFTFKTGFEPAENDAVERAKKVCEWLEISHQVVDIQEEFQKKVVNSFISYYKQARTPNPCVVCNREIKFGLLLDKTLKSGAQWIATGHYIRFVQRDGLKLIQRGSDPLKDQSYFLCMLRKESLEHMMFPLGELTKADVKQKIYEIGLPLPEKLGESQDVCFVEKDYRDFLKKAGVKGESGDYQYNGKVVGQHSGIPYYALGQRRGLGVSVGHRVFVREMHTQSRQIILGEKPVSQEFELKNLNLFVPHLEKEKYQIQVRYQSRVIMGKVYIEGEKIRVVLDQPHEIITAGQFAAIYDQDLLVAGGEIANPVLL